MTKKKLKRIDIHKDYVMYELMNHANDGVRILCDYMQKVTPYGETYQKAFDQYKKMRKALEVFEDCLAECVEIANKNDGESYVG